MPIICNQTLKPLAREEFGRLSYDLMAEVFAMRLVSHADIDALLWANLGRHEITFCCLKPES